METVRTRPIESAKAMRAGKGGGMAWSGSDCQGLVTARGKTRDAQAISGFAFGERAG